MAKCPYCDAEVTTRFCIYCGAEVGFETEVSPEPPAQTMENYQNGSAPEANGSAPYTGNYGAAPYAAADTAPQTKLGGWIGWVALVAFMPLFGAVIALCCSNDESVKNYAKASLIMLPAMAVAAVIMFVMVCLFIAAATGAV